MRNLTIKRTKSFVGCIGKLKIYIEDPASNELTINDVPCRKIGDLKNGEEKTFQIGEQAAKVFVIADTLSKDYSNDFYQLPEGQEDISLTGKNKFNLAAGNAFRFDNNPTEGIAAAHKKGARKGLIILILCAVVGGIVGYSATSGLLSNKASKPKTFTADGMSITLTDAFRKTTASGFTAAYDSKNVAVFALQEPFAMADGAEDYTPEDYANLVIQVNNVSAQVKTSDGLTSFTYSSLNSETGELFRYYSYVYKTGDSFWLIQFAMRDKDTEEFAPQTIPWAKSVTFSN